MGRSIRLSEAEARAAGLLDPLVFDLVRPKKVASKISPPKGGAKSRQGDEATNSDSPKKRSRSRPAAHPTRTLGPAGTGEVTTGAGDLVAAASFTFHVVPVPKERARVVRDPETDRTFAFTPARTRHFHAEIKGVIERVLGRHKPISGPVRFDMTFAIQIPKSWPKWKQSAARDGLIVPTGRPDMDNLEKALLDACNSTLIVDDAYVMERHARKIYADLPRIDLQVCQTGKFDINVQRSVIEAARKTLQEG